MKREQIDNSLYNAVNSVSQTVSQSLENGKDVQTDPM